MYNQAVIIIKILQFQRNRINKLHIHVIFEKRNNSQLGEEQFITFKSLVYTQIVSIYNLAIE